MNALKQVVVGVLLMTSAWTAPALAQGLELSLGGGVSLPVGDFGDAASTGWHGLAGLAFARGPVGVRVDGAYHRFGFDNQGGPDLDIHTQVLQGTANVVYKFKTSDETTIRPYLIGGGGVYLSEVKGDDDPGDSADFGLNAGAGLDLRLGAVGAFVEARFHNIFMMGTNTNSAFIPITVGVRLGGG